MLGVYYVVRPRVFCGVWMYIYLYLCLNQCGSARSTSDVRLLLQQEEENENFHELAVMTSIESEYSFPYTTPQLYDFSVAKTAN